ncbi:type III secretion system inner rod subunit SctI [Shewanella surugensis]|uniref:Type III secretion system inner rod subunit SctI n=1 Tax=Shewanella surugensis TaxID=212020 RepID=A0ABT0L857_9GAMM|nr:type III secretion system inner rod subunit SctI [Shewanella surugensis]MCL1123675.1 type III secretion system inner rod subunit SctI [Shewanella surugensis]
MISKTTQLATQQLYDPAEKVVDVKLQDQFSQLMNVGNADLEGAVRATENKPVSNGVDVVQATLEMITPEAMHEGQRLIAKAMIEVDLVAKVAGSVSQGINKLVTMG